MKKSYMTTSPTTLKIRFKHHNYVPQLPTNPTSPDKKSSPFDQIIYTLDNIFSDKPTYSEIDTN